MREFFRTLLQRMAALFRRRRLEDDLDEELRSHLEMAIELNLRKGMSAEDARREALRSFGGVEQTKENYRDQRGLPMIETTLQDLRFGLRMLRRSPGFSLLAILCLTLGIGANAAVFSWVEGILFRPYPLVSHQEQLLALTGTARGESGPTGISWPDLLDLERSSTLIDSFIVNKIMGTTLSVGDRAERMTGSIVSANYFDAIGVHPILGRGFESGEDVGRNAHPVTVISYQLWKGKYKRDPQIIGKTERLNGVIHTIVGVEPEGFYGTFVGWAMQFWVPASMEEIFEAGGYKLEDRGARWIEAYVRLKPGATQAQAQAQISAAAKRLEAEYPETNRGRGIELWPLWQTPFNNAGTLLPTLEIMITVVVFVLLIACANVGNLLLVRSFARRHEMTVRLAIGAGRGRLLKQLFTEGVILSAIGAGAGLLVAHWCRHALVLLFPARGGVAMHLPGEIDWRVLALSAGVSVIATLLLGLVPAMQTGKIDLAGALKSDSAGVVGGGGKAWVRSGLVVVQVSLSFVLLVGAGLLLQSLQRIRNTSPGFSTRGVMVTAVDLVSAGYDVQRAQNFQDELLDRVKALPGVDEKAALVAVVNETMAAHYWRDRNPIGERLQVKGRWMQVVGVAKDSKYQSVREAPMPFFYVSRRQNFSRGGGLHIRTPLSPETMATVLGREVHALDPDLALYEVITLQEQVDRSTSPQQVAVTLVGVLGGLALLLAVIGLYGVMSYAVSQSARELGLRMALGAGASNLLRLVMKRGLALTAGGVALGAAVALGLTRLLGNLLYNVSPRDPLAFGSAFLVMTIAALAACLLPAWRATRTDPVQALRE